MKGESCGVGCLGVSSSDFKIFGTNFRGDMVPTAADHE